MDEEQHNLDLDERLASDDDALLDFNMGRNRQVDGPVDLEAMKDPFFVSEHHENVERYCRAIEEGVIPDPYNPKKYK